jgi:hypothetical protein
LKKVSLNLKISCANGITIDFASTLKLWRVKSLKKTWEEIKIVATCKVRLGLLRHLVFGVPWSLFKIN